MPIPKYYVRPDGLHESIITVNGKRKAFRGKTDREVWNKIKAYRAEADEPPARADVDVEGILAAVEGETGEDEVPSVDLPSGIGLAEVHALRVAVPLKTAIAGPQTRVAAVRRVPDDVVPHAGRMGAPPEVDIAVVLLEDEVFREQGGSEVVEHREFARRRYLSFAEEVAYGLCGRKIASSQHRTHYF